WRMSGFLTGRNPIQLDLLAARHETSVRCLPWTDYLATRAPAARIQWRPLHSLLLFPRCRPGRADCQDCNNNPRTSACSRTATTYSVSPWCTPQKASCNASEATYADNTIPTGPAWSACGSG